MTDQVIQAMSRIDAMVPERRQPKAAKSRIAGVEPLRHKRPEVFARRARDRGGQARNAGFTQASAGVDCGGHQFGIAPTHCQSAEHEKFAWFGVVRKTGLSSLPTRFAGRHEAFEIGFKALVDATDVGFIENGTVDLPTSTKP